MGRNEKMAKKGLVSRKPLPLSDGVEAPAKAVVSTIKIRVSEAILWMRLLDFY
jgi:hypothetical protein